MQDSKGAGGAPTARRRTVLSIVAAAALTLALAPQAFAGAVIDNGTIRLGINDHGDLNFGGFGVNYIPTGHDGTRAGCPCEGWGAGGRDGGTAFEGGANRNFGGPLPVITLDSFTSTASTATSVTTVGGRLRVTQEYAPLAGTPNLYEDKVTIRNITGHAIQDVRYTRLMDWDVEPTAFREFVTIQRGSTPPANLLRSNDDGFDDPRPFQEHNPLDPATDNANFTDLGPRDHGALFDFGFGELAAGEEVTFSIFYGAAGTEPAADAAVSAAGLELYSYGQPNGGQSTGAPNTFIFGFRAVGGEPVIPPTLELTPETATNTVGDPHTMTAELRDSSGNPVSMAPIVFQVTGANPQPAASRTTGADGRATYTYTGTTEGNDSILACFDSNTNGSCDSGEVSDTARKTWVAGGSEPEPVTEGRMVGNATRGDMDYASIIDCDAATANAKNRPFTVQWKTGSTTNTFKLTNVSSVLCTDDPGVGSGSPPNGFDKQSGEGVGTLNGVSGYQLSWVLTDAGMSGDQTQLVVRDSGGTVVKEQPLGSIFRKPRKNQGQNYALGPA